MRTIVNISGYNGQPENNIFRLVNSMPFDYDIEIIAPRLAHRPSVDFPYLLDIVKSIQPPVVIMAKSMGAFYAGILSSVCKTPMICFNPSFNPLKNLKFNDEDTQVLLDHDYSAFVFDQESTCYMSLCDTRIDHLDQIKKYSFLANSYTVLVGSYDHDFDGIERDAYLSSLIKWNIDYYFKTNLHPYR